MRLKPPDNAPRIALADVDGKPVMLGGSGRRTLLCFFRDPDCPFCNFRVRELAQRYQQLANLGLDVIAVFSASPDEVRRAVFKRPQPFPVVADSALEAYAAYGIERSFWRKARAIATRIPTLIRGLGIVGLAGLKTSDLLPADFLIDEEGRIVEAWYGRDAGDRIPFQHVEWFMARSMLERTVSTA